MFLRFDRIKSENSRGRSRKIVHLSCDHCTKEFTRRSIPYIENARHFCTHKCRIQAMKKGGKLDKIIAEKNFKKFGTMYPLQCEEIKEKAKKTLIEKFNVDNILKHPDVRAKAIEKAQSYDAKIKHQTSLLNNAKERLMKGKKTLKDRYGVEHNFQIESVKLKRKITWKTKYGTDYPIQTSVVQAKIQKTNLRKYGVKYFISSLRFKESFDREKSTQKRHATMKKNGSYGKSKIEDKCFECLKKYFTNVERQVDVNGWAIDFRVQIDEGFYFIQFDGVYWHGLNRHEDTIRLSSNPRDKVILMTMHRDIQQNVWFKENNMNLFRITDQEFKAVGISSLLVKILNVHDTKEKTCV